MIEAPVPRSVTRTFWKALAALLACVGLTLAGCSKASDEDVELPSWLTEEEAASEPADGEMSVTENTEPTQLYDVNGQPLDSNAPQAVSFNTAATTSGIPEPSPLTAPGLTSASPVTGASVPSTNQSPTSSGSPALPTAPPLEKAQLRLNLQLGARLPLIKVIETELTQSSHAGLPEVHKSRLELGMIVTVEEQRGDQTRLSVRYNRIKLLRDAGGRRLEFDSSNPIVQTTQTPELVAYRAMVGDGFSYWISADNQVTGVDGFQEFMNRCLGHMPDAAQRAAMLGIEGSSGESGLADFIDSTIGLLPYNSAKAVGESWSREVAIARPVPMRRTERYTLKHLDPVIASVQVEAEIAPSTSLGDQMASDGGVRVVIKGGRLTGTAEIFRDSGLPKQSRTTETLDMVVQMAGGIEFGQTKSTTTTISAYPPQAF